MSRETSIYIHWCPYKTKLSNGKMKETIKWWKEILWIDGLRSLDWILMFDGTNIKTKMILRNRNLWKHFYFYFYTLNGNRVCVVEIDVQLNYNVMDEVWQHIFQLYKTTTMMMMMRCDTFLIVNNKKSFKLTIIILES